jgi:hypothetical protein
VYFAKKFLRLEHVVDAQVGVAEAAAALRENADVYGLVLLNFADLCADKVDGLLHALQLLSARSARHSLVVYNVKHCTDRDLDVMKSCGVVAVLKEPHTVAALKVNLYGFCFRHQCWYLTSSCALCWHGAGGAGEARGKD